LTTLKSASHLSASDDIKELIEPQVWIDSIQFSGGQTINLSQDDIVLIVGANNAGKSKTLEELHNLLNTQERLLAQKLANHLVVKSATLKKVGSAEDFRKYLFANATLEGHHFHFRGGQIHENHVQNFDSSFLFGSSQAFQLKLNATGRTNAVSTANSIAHNEAPSIPQHYLYNDKILMKRVSDLFESAFGQELFFNYRGGSQIPIHVGKKPLCDTGEQYVDNSYVEKVTAFPKIDEQGDGIKSYAGILFQTLVYPRDITYIDEPEAFLHPPQMRRLGKTLAENSSGQIIVATHSTDILRGFLEAQKDRVRVIRLRREANNNHATELPPERIQELWSHPQIRYSTALDAIFHEQAIICEDDSDCRLYSAVADHLEVSNTDIRWKDTHYIPTGGKHSAARVAKALHELNVPTKMIFDFDLISDENSIKATYESVGGVWSNIKNIWTRLDAAVRKGVKSKTPKEVAAEINELLEEVGERLPKSKIQELLKQDKPWSIVKKTGSIAIPNGDATKAYHQLKDALQAAGIFMVEKGEIEQFCPSIGNDGPKFVSNLLETKELDGEELKDLRDFVQMVAQA